MNETDPMHLYRKLKERQERGDLPTGPATAWMLEAMDAGQARFTELPEDERELALASLMAYVALTAVADVDKRLAEVERKLDAQDAERTRERLQYNSYGGGMSR